MAIKRSIVRSSGISLNFPDEELYIEHQRKEEELYLQTYIKIRNKYGIWASNQGKFVKTPEELNEWDNKTAEREFSSWQN